MRKARGCCCLHALAPSSDSGVLAFEVGKRHVQRFVTQPDSDRHYSCPAGDSCPAGGVAELYVYKKTDTVTATFDTVSVTLSKTISLPLVGGSSALASMAANTKFLFVGTNQSPSAVEIQKGTFIMTQIGGFSPPINVSAITSDKYGYVTVTFGSFGGGESGFVVFGPDGAGREDGGGAPFMLNTDQAVLPSTLP